VAGFGRIVLTGLTVVAALGTVALRAQTALEDPKNAPKIFANTCSACHKSPAGLGKNGSASFLRQHYTTGPEMSAAMAAYLASAGNAPPSK
jgi:mono/diheme cytochrome c family protein